MRQPSDQIKIGNYSYMYSNIMDDKIKYTGPGSDDFFNRTYYNVTTHKVSSLYTDPSTPSSKAKEPMARSPEVAKAIDGINYVCEHLRKEDLEKMVFSSSIRHNFYQDKLLYSLKTSMCYKGKGTVEICGIGH